MFLCVSVMNYFYPVSGVVPGEKPGMYGGLAGSMPPGGLAGSMPPGGLAGSMPPGHAPSLGYAQQSGLPPGAGLGPGSGLPPGAGLGPSTSLGPAGSLNSASIQAAAHGSPGYSSPGQAYAGAQAFSQGSVPASYSPSLAAYGAPPGMHYQPGLAYPQATLAGPSASQYLTSQATAMPRVHVPTTTTGFPGASPHVAQHAQAMFGSGPASAMGSTMYGLGPSISPVYAPSPYGPAGPGSLYTQMDMTRMQRF